MLLVTPGAGITTILFFSPRYGNRSVQVLLCYFSYCSVLNSWAGGCFSLRRMALLVLKAPLRVVRFAKMLWSPVSVSVSVVQFVSCFVSSKALGNAQQFSCLHMLSSCCGAELISLQRDRGVRQPALSKHCIPWFDCSMVQLTTRF